MAETSVVDILIALGSAGTVGAAVNFIFNRRGLRADASKVIAEAAATVTGTMEKRLSSLELYAEARRVTDAAHEDWDRQIWAELLRLNPATHIKPPPPLQPSAALLKSLQDEQT